MLPAAAGAARGVRARWIRRDPAEVTAFIPGVKDSQFDYLVR